MSELFQTDISLNQEAFDLWLKYRKEIKKPFKSAMTIEGQQNKIIKLSGGDYQKQMDIVMQSIDEGWTGLFELKQPATPPQQSEGFIDKHTNRDWRQDLLNQEER